MGLCFNLLVICGVFIMVCIVSRWDKRAAYRILESSQHLFEPEHGDDEANTPRTLRPGKRHATSPQTPNPTAKRRPYVSPLVKKRVAARQKWRCAMCKEILDETYEIDHKIPLFQGGHPTQESNLQALCKRDHMFKSSVLDRQ